MTKVALILRLRAMRGRLPALSLLLASLLLLAVTGTALATHVRPKGATPKRDSLVIAYKPCAGPTASHASPASYPSCPGPTQTSPWLTAGTMAANGLPANFIGSTRLDLCPAGCPGGPAAEDIKITISMTDVRCTAALAGATPAVCGPGGALDKYLGTVKVVFPMQITDHCNVPGPPPAACPAPPGTAATGPPGPYSLPFPVTVPCGGGPPGVGSTCALITTVNVITGPPGLIIAGQQHNIEIGTITVSDGGSDGSVATVGDGEAVFADEGVFAP